VSPVHCSLALPLSAGAQEITGQPLDVFMCGNTLVNGALKPKPKSLAVDGDVSDDIKMGASEQEKEAGTVALKTLDIFAGVLDLARA
jgi:hypothetical protein